MSKNKKKSYEAKKEELMDLGIKSLKLYNGILIGSLAVTTVGLGVCGVAAAQAQIESNKLRKERELEDYLSKLEAEDSKKSDAK